MAHWIKHARHTHSDTERVAVFELEHGDLDLLAAFYQEVTHNPNDPILGVGDQIEIARVFAMIADAADWTDTSEYEEENS